MRGLIARSQSLHFAIQRVLRSALPTRPEPPPLPESRPHWAKSTLCEAELTLPVAHHARDFFIAQEWAVQTLQTATAGLKEHRPAKQMLCT